MTPTTPPAGESFDPVAFLHKFATTIRRDTEFAGGDEEWLVRTIKYRIEKHAARLRPHLADAGRVANLEAACRDFLDYVGVGKGHPWDRLAQLFREERARVRNRDDQDFWRFAEAKVDTIRFALSPGAARE